MPLSTITRAALATPHCVDAGTHTDAPSAVSPTDSLQWRASSCSDRLCLTLISARPPHHKKAPVLSHPDNRCFSVRLRGRFSVPTCRTAPRRAQKAVKAGRRPPPQAAQCGLDGREHGATLYQVGSARFLADTPSGRGGLPTWCLRGYRPLLFLLATTVGSPIVHIIRSSTIKRRNALPGHLPVGG